MRRMFCLAGMLAVFPFSSGCGAQESVNSIRPPELNADRSHDNDPIPPWIDQFIGAFLESTSPVPAHQTMGFSIESDTPRPLPSPADFCESRVGINKTSQSYSGEFFYDGTSIGRGEISIFYRIDCSDAAGRSFDSELQVDIKISDEICISSVNLDPVRFRFVRLTLLPGEQKENYEANAQGAYWKNISFTLESFRYSQRGEDHLGNICFDRIIVSANNDR